MTAVEVFETTTHQPPARPVAGPVTLAELELMERQAEILARSSIIPKDYRGKPENIVVAAITGRAFSWDVMQAMRNGHVIEGVWGMRPEAMLALIRAAGHSVTGESRPDSATVMGKRCDTGDELAVTFTIHDAIRARLCRLGNDGMPYARSDSGKVMPWEQYPQAMCWWRAIAQLARFLFSDVTLGISYTPEELGAVVNEAGEVIDVDDLPALPAAPASAPASTSAAPVTNGDGVDLGPVISAPNAAKLVTRCEAERVDVADVVRRGTNGRTSDATEIRYAEVRPVKAALDHYIEARDQGAAAA